MKIKVYCLWEQRGLAGVGRKGECTDRELQPVFMGPTAMYRNYMLIKYQAFCKEIRETRFRVVSNCVETERRDETSR